MHQNNIQYNNSNCVSFQPMHGIPSEITDGFFRLRSTTLKEELLTKIVIKEARKPN